MDSGLIVGALTAGIGTAVLMYFKLRAEDRKKSEPNPTERRSDDETGNL